MRSSIVLSLSLVATLVQFTRCDVYLHMPRGSNNRLNEKSANRRNANRVCDSQVRIWFHNFTPSNRLRLSRKSSGDVCLELSVR